MSRIPEQAHGRVRRNERFDLDRGGVHHTRRPPAGSAMTNLGGTARRLRAADVRRRPRSAHAGHCRPPGARARSALRTPAGGIRDHGGAAPSITAAATMMRLESEDEVRVRQHASCQHDRRMGPEIDAEPSARVDCMLECGCAGDVERAERSRARVEATCVPSVERLGQRTSRSVTRADEGDLERVVRARDPLTTAALSRRTSWCGRSIGREPDEWQTVRWIPVVGG